ncbi:MAG TPA: Holliday junction resolvase-like protein [Methanospirillum sp.]|jgi:predicted Holliday junction resolvase-like endonuclease|uniref:Holliday junction resolvase-like protein n=1 Tax=Methanospirillum sp. TaxID=45200 RepID=UPI0009D55F4E|nr:Holliday junction resolvase-like protein [Methanospirillum sp.]OQB55439.1 MAG: Endonuclease related to archaeal Holliday junction resolvase [Bacteroidetes bacterium ADurb.Bin145]HPY60693.1 Holliday junction resolvase-like protein [Methanospirillum sp.]
MGIIPVPLHISSQGIILLLFLLIITLLAALVLVWRRGDKRARALFESWKKEEYSRLLGWISMEADKRAAIQADAICREWQRNEEQKIRKDAVRRSHSVIRGKVTEHLIPWFPEFSYHPSDARFLGSPVDFIVFNGLSEGCLEEIVIVEVKTGLGSLSPRERSVARIIKEGRVRFEMIRKE